MLANTLPSLSPRLHSSTNPAEDFVFKIWEQTRPNFALQNLGGQALYRPSPAIVPPRAGHGSTPNFRQILILCSLARLPAVVVRARYCLRLT